MIARRKLAVLKVSWSCSYRQQIHSTLHPEMAQLLEGKNLLAWKALMEETGFDDPSLFDELTKGFRLVDQATVSPQCQQLPGNLSFFLHL